MRAQGSSRYTNGRGTPTGSTPPNEERLLYLRGLVLARINRLTTELEILKHAYERVKQTISWMVAMEAEK